MTAYKGTKEELLQTIKGCAIVGTNSENEVFNMKFDKSFQIAIVHDSSGYNPAAFLAILADSHIDSALETAYYGLEQFRYDLMTKEEYLQLCEDEDETGFNTVTELFVGYYFELTPVEFYRLTEQNEVLADYSLDFDDMTEEEEKIFFAKTTVDK